MPTPCSEFAARLKAAREKAGLSQEAAGRIVDVDASTIANWEHRRSEPKASQIQALARGYGIDPGALFMTEAA